jgi:hypothetical protein
MKVLESIRMKFSIIQRYLHEQQKGTKDPTSEVRYCTGGTGSLPDIGGCALQRLSWNRVGAIRLLIKESKWDSARIMRHLGTGGVAGDVAAPVGSVTELLASRRRADKFDGTHGTIGRTPGPGQSRMMTEHGGMGGNN